MISIRSPIAAVALVALAATMATANHHHHHDHNDGGNNGFVWNWGGTGEQSQSESIANCLCWNATSDNWCHHALDGSNTGFWRQSCNRAVQYNAWWAVPVTLWALYLAFMPMFLCAFRLCCNCCGGRTPSFGCCCPISNRILSPDPKWTRPYSRCATWTAKCLAVFFCAGMISLSVHSFIHNHSVHHDVMQTSTMLTSVVDNVLGEVKPADFAAKKPAWMNAAALGVLNKVQSVVSPLESMKKDLSKADQTDRARMVPTAWVVGSTLCLTILVTLVALCNVRSWPISCASGILSILTLLVLIVATVTLAVSTTMDVYCENRPVVKSFAKTLMASQQLCNLTDVTKVTNDTQIAYARYLCTDLGLNTMAFNGTTGFCTETLGGMFVPASMEARMPTGTLVVDADRLYTLIWSTAAPKAVRSDLSSITTTYNAVYRSLTYVMAQNYQCRLVDTAMDLVISPILCDNEVGSAPVAGSYVFVTGSSLRRNLHHLAALLFGLATMATLAFWVWMNGSKRFTKSASKEELMGHHDLQRQQMASLSYDYLNHTNQQTAAPQVVAQPGVYDDGVNGPQKPATTAVVAATVEQPLLLTHNTPQYNSVNNRDAADVDLPVKEQPQPL